MEKNLKKSQENVKPFDKDKVTEQDLEDLLPVNVKVARQPLREAKYLLSDSLEDPTNEEFLKRMIILKIDRPPWVDREVWERVYVTPNEEIICRMVSFAMTEEEIAEKLNMRQADVSLVLSFKRCQDRVSDLLDTIWSQNPRKWLEKMLPKAMETVYSIMMDKTIKPGVRLAAAESIMDRVMGKATQKLEIEDSTIKDVLNRIDELSRQEKEAQKTIELQKEKGIPCEEKESDRIDSWVAENRF